MISVVAGATVTGTFLPDGASIILYSQKDKLDLAFWNNFPQVKTHWFPLDAQEETRHELIQIVGAELEYFDNTQK
jgi:hypothetical protein